MKTDYSKRLRHKYFNLIFSIIYDIFSILFTGFFIGYAGYYFILIDDNQVFTIILLVFFSTILTAFLYFIQNLIKSIKQYKTFDLVEYLEKLKKEDEVLKREENYCLIKKDF